MTSKLYKFLFQSSLFALFLGLVACGSAPEAESLWVDAQLQDRGYIKAEAASAPIVYWHKKATKSRTLLVFIGGDGLPWVDQGRRIAKDPTAKDEVTIELMLELQRYWGEKSLMFLGRPCYYLNRRYQDRRYQDGEDHDGMAELCEAKYWTSARYSEQVVSWMSQALESVMLEYEYRDLVLIGYSGGASLALLLASELSHSKDRFKISSVVSVAGNLDVDAWSQFHGYLPLSQSLSPADIDFKGWQLPLLVLSGAKDTNVPVSSYREIFEQESWRSAVERGLIEVETISEADHRCCWKGQASSIDNFVSKFN